MVKKSLVVGGVIVLLLGLFFGRDAISYTKTSLGWVRQSVKDAVPVKFELNRARDMIKGLRPEIEHNMHVIATEEVEIDGLRTQLASGEKQLAKNKADIERLTTDLKNGGSSFVYCGKSYTGKQVKTDPNGGDPSQLLGWDHFGMNDIGHDILPEICVGAGAIGCTPPLGPGNYSFWVQETTSCNCHYRFIFNVTGAASDDD